jgi:hypothetical protein
MTTDTRPDPGDAPLPDLCATCGHWVDEHAESGRCYGLDLAARPCPCLDFAALVDGYSPTVPPLDSCPVPGCPADHYPHDPDDHGHANPCGCDWHYTCDPHATRYALEGISPGLPLNPATGLPMGAELDDDPDGLAAELTAELDDRLFRIGDRPSAALRGPGFLPAEELFRRMDGSAWLGILDLARADRRRWARAHAARDLATAAAEYGIVPTGLEYDRGAELARVWSDQMGQARSLREWHAAGRPHETGTESAMRVGYYAWPGDMAADYDASAERYELGPHGRSGTYATLPPIYRAGVERMTHREWATYVHWQLYPTADAD